MNALSESQTTPSQFRQYLAAFVVNLGVLSYGFSMGWASNALTELQKPESTIPLTPEEASWVVSLLFLGGVFSVSFFSFVPNKIGCKKAGYFTGLMLIGSYIVTILSQTAVQLYIGRFLTGFAGGICYVLSPLYVVQFADINIRGILGSILTLNFTSGIAFAYAIGGFLSYERTLYIGLFIALLFEVSFIILPEAPRHLIKNGNIDEAVKSLQWFRGKNYDVSNEIDSIKESMNSVKADGNGTFPIKLLTSKSVLRGLCIVITHMVNFHVTGVMAVITHANIIFQESGSLIPPEYSTISIGFCQIIGNVSGMILVERLGRKILLIISDSVTAAMLLLMGTYFYLKTIDVDVSSVEWLPVLCLSIYIIFIAMGLGPLMYVILAEVIPTSILPLIQQFSYSLLWFLGFLVTKYFYIIKDCLSMYGSFWLFSVCCIIAITILSILLPETKGKSLDEIQFELGGKKAMPDIVINRKSSIIIPTVCK